MKYLTEHGIAKAALVARGFGIDKPLADSATEEGREKNRRVEFNIVEQDVTSKKIGSIRRPAGEGPRGEQADAPDRSPASPRPRHQVSGGNP
jgi:hypothetical protein